ncbi:MAG TPA: hypothetical protein DEB39_16860 [Planctomycetaceae bacterium]|nr:hypothetical protein [Planctomycetaceae bacterium]
MIPGRRRLRYVLETRCKRTFGQACLPHSIARDFCLHNDINGSFERQAMVLGRIMRIIRPFTV